jgi:hypothetical protein
MPLRFDYDALEQTIFRRGFRLNGFFTPAERAGYYQIKKKYDLPFNAPLRFAIREINLPAQDIARLFSHSGKHMVFLHDRFDTVIRSEGYAIQGFSARWHQIRGFEMADHTPFPVFTPIAAAIHKLDLSPKDIEQLIIDRK